MLVDEYSRLRASGLKGAETSRRNMLRRGKTFNGDALWTEAEDETCRRLYPNYASMIEVMRHRSYYALKNHCRILQIVAPKHVWTNQEVSRLRKIYGEASHAELRSAFPDVDLNQIQKKARHIGLHRNDRAFKLTGHALLDALRRRCRELRYSMVDLDEMACTGRYFQKQTWCNKQKFDHLKIKAGIEAIGGKLTVDWGE